MLWYGTATHAEAFARRQQGRGEMAQRADAADRVVDLARTLADVGDELAGGMHGQVGVDGERHAVDGDHPDRRQVLGRIEGQPLHLRQDRDGRAAGEIDGISVIRRSRGVLGPDRSAGPAAVLDDEGLAIGLPQPIREQTRDDVGDPARAIGDDDLDGAARPVLRP